MAKISFGTTSQNSWLRGVLRYGALLLVEAILVYYSFRTNTSDITTWLVGVNFVLGISSINFTFFGHQLSKYKPLLGELTARQWANIIALSALPFVPLAIYLGRPLWFARAALWAMPVLIWSAYDNAILTARYLDPIHHLHVGFTDDKVGRYIGRLFAQAQAEVSKHKSFLEKIKSAQLPLHGHRFETTAIGVRDHDLWDQLTVIAKLSVDNNDYPVFVAATDAVVRLLSASYQAKFGNDGDYDARDAVAQVSHLRFRAIVSWLLEKDKEGTHIQALINNLCGFLLSDRVAPQKDTKIVNSLLGDLAWVGKKLLARDDLAEPLKIVNTVHAIIELLEVEHSRSASSAPVEDLMVSEDAIGYAHLIGQLGADAFENKRPHVGYRCMETLSYVGSNAAKHLPRGRRLVATCLAMLVHIGRTARATDSKCFWSHCSIPPESHAEEFMGHILTWLVKDMAADGGFPLKLCAETAYSRIRGKVCTISPKPGRNPFFWVEEQKNETGKVTPHIESMSGKYGYSGRVDYSDLEELKEYQLYDLD